MGVLRKLRHLRFGSVINYLFLRVFLRQRIVHEFRFKKSVISIVFWIKFEKDFKIAVKFSKSIQIQTFKNNLPFFLNFIVFLSKIHR